MTESQRVAHFWASILVIIANFIVLAIALTGVMQPDAVIPVALSSSTWLIDNIERKGAWYITVIGVLVMVVLILCAGIFAYYTTPYREPVTAIQAHTTGKEVGKNEDISRENAGKYIDYLVFGEGASGDIVGKKVRYSAIRIGAALLFTILFTGNIWCAYQIKKDTGGISHQGKEGSGGPMGDDSPKGFTPEVAPRPLPQQEKNDAEATKKDRVAFIIKIKELGNKLAAKTKRRS